MSDREIVFWADVDEDLLTHDDMDEAIEWMCEEVERRQIVVADWIREHRPDWLVEAKK